MKSSVRLSLAVGASLAVVAAGTTLVASAAESSLQLATLLRRVADANLNIATEKHEVNAVRAERSGAWSIFEPQLTTEFTREGNRRLNSRERFLSQASPLFEENNTVYGGSLEFLSPVGTRMRYGAQIRDLRNNLQVRAGNEPAQNHNEWDGFAGVTLTQPLLKNFGLGPTLASVRIARAQADGVLHQARGNIAGILSAAELSYWELYGADEELKLRRRSIEIATKLLEDNRARVEAGRMGDLEIYQAEAGLVLRETQAAEAMQRTIEASALLRAFLGESVEGVTTAFTPVNVPDAADLIAAPLTGAHDSALARHPEYLARAAIVREQEERARFARNQRLPQFDLKASYGLNGLGGTIDNWYNSAETGDYPSWFVGFQLSLPVGPGIRERAGVRAAASRLAGARASLAAAEIDLTNQVAAGQQRIDHLRTRLANYEKVTAYHEKVLAAELAALDLGRSDSRRVLQAEQDLAEVRADALRQRLELRRAIIDSEVLNGSYLQSRGLDLADEEE
jgi:outer membrane protein TolC